MSKDALQGWTDLSLYPDLATDLGYQVEEWEAVESRTGEEELLLFLPTDQDLLKEEAFVIASPDAVHDLDEHR